MDARILDVLTSAGGSTMPLVVLFFWARGHFDRIDGLLRVIERRLTLNEAADAAARGGTVHHIAREDTQPPHVA